MKAFLKQNSKLVVCTMVFFTLLLTEFQLKKTSIETYPVFAGMYIFLFIATGVPVIVGSIRGIVAEHDFFSEEVLMLLASLSAVFTADYAEAAAIMIFYRIGDALGDYSTDTSRDRIIELMNLNAEKCRISEESGEREIAADELKKGDRVILVSGSMVPADGIVEDGSGSFNTSSITGESVPLFCSRGDTLLSGYILVEGRVYMTVVSVASESTAAKILEMVGAAGEKKSRHEKFTDRFVRIYTPIMMLSFIVVAFACPFVFGGGIGDIGSWLYRAAGFMVAGCPCALVVSVPLAYFAAIGSLARSNVFVKNPQSLEAVGKCDLFCFDKTGTLTDGKFEIKDFETAIDEKKFKTIVASAENFSMHPIAQSICREWKSFIVAEKISELREIAGIGIEFSFDDTKYLICGSKGAAELGTDMGKADTNAVMLISEGKLVGVLTMADRLKTGAAGMIGYLVSMGIEPLMLTGDGDDNARATAAAAGIAKVHSGLLPADKLEIVDSLLGRGKHVAFVGDGINDAACVRRADVGIASGGVAAASVREASDIVIENNDLMNIPGLLKKSRKTVAIVCVNIVFSLLFKFLVIVLSLFSLVPMWLCVFADGGVLMLAVMNSLRLS